jgi:hypothetical protein
MRRLAAPVQSSGVAERTAPVPHDQAATANDCGDVAIGRLDQHQPVRIVGHVLRGNAGAGL